MTYHLFSVSMPILQHGNLYVKFLAVMKCKFVELHKRQVQGIYCETEQRLNSADKGLNVTLTVLRFQKILKAAKSCLKIAEVTTSISKGAFLCKVTGG